MGLLFIFINIFVASDTDVTVLFRTVKIILTLHFYFLGYHCLCTNEFVVVLMFEVSQSGTDLSVMSYIQNEI